MLAAKWLHLALYRISLFQIKHYNSVLEYLVDIRSEDWLKLFWECGMHKWKIVYSAF
jgi:hypothetical protein